MKKNKDFYLIADLRKGIKFYFAFSKSEYQVCYKEEVRGNNLLKVLDKELNKRSLNLDNLKAIGFINGGKSFTSLRIGIVWANFFSFSYQIPVVGLKEKEVEGMSDTKILNLFFKKNKKALVNKFLVPEYYTEANITKRKPIW